LRFILVHTLHLTIERFPSPSNTDFAYGIFVDHTSWNFWITSTLIIFLGFFLIKANI
jgi:lipoprotein signal peptidase